MNAKTILLLVGLLIGGAGGWLTAPQPTQLQVGPLSVEVQGGNGNGNGGTVTATENNGQVQVQVSNGSPFNDPMMRTGIFGVIGAIVGLGIGVVMDRRKV